MPHKPRVFIPQQPTRRDPESGTIVPSMDLSPSRAYGRQVFLLTEHENPFKDLQATTIQLVRSLQDHGYGPKDWLLLVGNPILLGLVAALVARQVPVFRALQWDRPTRQYLPVEAQLAELVSGHVES